MPILGSMQATPLRLNMLIDYAAREHGRREIVTRWADGILERSNWAEIAAQSRRLAHWLTGLGMEKGDRIATLAMNHGLHLASWFGTAGMGGILHTVNPRLFDEQLVYIVNHAADRVLMFDRQYLDLVERLKPQWPTIEHFVLFDGQPGDPYPSLRDVLAGMDENFPWVDGDENDPCGLCYTSGTTGNPKGVIYEHRSNILHALCAAQPDVFDMKNRSVVMPIVPMFHANAWGLPFVAAAVGSKLVLCANNDPDVLWDLARSEQVTHSAGVPTVWLAMFSHLDAQGGGHGAFEQIIIGGSAAPRAMLDRFLSAGIRVGHAWGMTETSPIGTTGSLLPDWAERDKEARLDYLQQQGRVPLLVELRLVDGEGKELPRDGETSGNLQVRGPWVLRRYFGADDDAATADGWFDTGDVAAIAPDGTMRITDRSKDVIKSGGEWISSIELENCIMGLDGVAEAAAVGVHHPKWDERPILLIVKKPGAQIGEADVIAYLADKVAKWWLPDEVLFVDDLPHTATGKLSKLELRKQYRDYRLKAL